MKQLKTCSGILLLTSANTTQKANANTFLHISSLLPIDLLNLQLQPTLITRGLPPQQPSQHVVISNQSPLIIIQKHPRANLLGRSGRLFAPIDHFDRDIDGVLEGFLLHRDIFANVFTNQLAHLRIRKRQRGADELIRGKIMLFRMCDYSGAAASATSNTVTKLNLVSGFQLA